MNDTKANVFCQHCGATFSAFLEEMAAKNYKVMCPCCEKPTQYSPSDIVPPPKR